MPLLAMDITLPILIFLFLGSAIAVAKLFSWPVETSPFFVVACSVLFLYFSIYLHFLVIGAYTLVLMLGGLSCYAFTILGKEPKQYLTPGFILLSAFMLFMCGFAYFSHLSKWDELSHWAPHAKLIYLTHALPSSTVVLDHKNYPPGTALWQYLFTLGGSFSIGKVYVAQTILIYAPLFVFLQRFRWQQWPLVAVLIIAIYVLLTLLHSYLGPLPSLYLETLLAVYWGSAVAYYYLSDKKIKNILYLIPIMMCFVLFKIELMPFVLIVSFLILTDQFLHRSRLFWLTMLLPIFSWLCAFSWQLYLNKIHTQMDRMISTKWLPLWHNLISHSLSLEQKTIISRFVTKSLSHSIAPLIIIFFSCALALLLERKQRKFTLIPQALLLLAYVIFLLSLLVEYLFAFNMYEASELASYDRYINIFLSGWLLVLFAQFVVFIRNKTNISSNRVFKLVSFSFSVIVCVGVSYSYIVKTNKLRSTNGLWYQQQEINRISSSVKKNVGKNAKLFVVWQNSSGLQLSIIRYQLMPLTVVNSSPSFGKPYSLRDISTQNISPAQFLVSAKKVDYILLAYVDQNFWQHYAGLFPKLKVPFVTYTLSGLSFDNNAINELRNRSAESAYLYKVVKNGSKVLFEPVTHDK